MATTRPLFPLWWLQRLRGRGPRGHVLAAFCLMTGLVASGGMARPVDSSPSAALSESVTVVQTVLCPGTMVFQVRNNGAQPVTANPGATIAAHGTAVVALRYPWDAGMAYEVQFISATGAMFATTIDASTTAGAPPCS